MLAACLPCWHFVWSALVLFGWAQPFIDFIFWLPFIASPYQIGTFVLACALALIAVTATVGYVFGSVIGTIWNRVHQS